MKVKNSNRTNSKEVTSDEKTPSISTDPYASLVTLCDKKIRNLEKRKTKGVQLQEMLKSGKELNADQKSCASAVSEVDSNLDFIKEFVGVLSELKADFSREKASKSQESSSSAHQGGANVKVDSIKALFEIQNSLKKLVENLDKVKELPQDQDKILKLEEVDKLLIFWKLICPSSTSDSSARLKKIIHCSTLLLNKDQKQVNEELGLSYAQLNGLIYKIGHSLFMVKKNNEIKDKVQPEVVPPIPPVELVPESEAKQEAINTDQEEEKSWSVVGKGSNSARKRPQSGRFRKGQQSRRQENEENIKPSDQEAPASTPGAIVTNVNGSKITIIDTPKDAFIRPYRSGRGNYANGGDRRGYRRRFQRDDGKKTEGATVASN